MTPGECGGRAGPLQGFPGCPHSASTVTRAGSGFELLRLWGPLTAMGDIGFCRSPTSGKKET